LPLLAALPRRDGLPALLARDIADPAAPGLPLVERRASSFSVETSRFR
jgi:hypothetical protein